MAAAFLARRSDDARTFTHPIPDAADAMEAAVLFAERWPLSGQVSVTVTECETGREQCFRIDLEDGSVRSC